MKSYNVKYQRIVNRNCEDIAGAVCQFSYKDFEISYSKVFKPHEVMILEKSKTFKPIAGPFINIEDAIDYINGNY